ncbi:MAG: UvrD-helicase domain-containing protein, partial [Chitinophagaceae bacterium]
MTKDFDVLEIELNGKKLIEASAGTGKTFSVALLVLRLVVEKKIPVNQILLMTFTNAAVAEMEERIRIFIRQAYGYLNGHPISNDTIKEYLDRKTDHEKIEATALLKDALLDLDQTSVMTIHAFCSKM